MRTIIGIAVAGALGALARYGLGSLVGRHGEFPWSTLAVNLLGAILLGVVVGWFVRTLSVPMWAQTVIVVGFLGAFTTFSTFSLETMELWDRGRYLLVLGYVAASVIGSVVALRITLTLAR